MKSHLVAISLCLIFSTGSNASHISINNGSFGTWDTLVSVTLGPNSKNTFDEDGVQVQESSITGVLSIYLNTVYLGTPATVEVDFSSTNKSLDPMILTLNNNLSSTNLLTSHRLDQNAEEFCSSNPNEIFCTNFDPGNSSVNNSFSIGTVESGLDVELNLGFISLVADGSNTILEIDNVGYLVNDDQISLSLSASDDFGNTEAYIFDSNPVPLPASIWFFMSGCIALFSLRKRKIT